MVSFSLGQKNMVVILYEVVVRQGSTVLANVHESQALKEFEMRNNLIILPKIIFSLLKVILMESLDEIFYCNHM